MCVGEERILKETQTNKLHFLWQSAYFLNRPRMRWSYFQVPTIGIRKGLLTRLEVLHNVADFRYFRFGTVVPVSVGRRCGHPGPVVQRGRRPGTAGVRQGRRGQHLRRAPISGLFPFRCALHNFLIYYAVLVRRWLWKNGHEHEFALLGGVGDGVSKRIFNIGTNEGTVRYQRPELKWHLDRWAQGCPAITQ